MTGSTVAPSAAREESVRSVDRALSILQVIAEQGTVGVSQIARATRIHKSTVFRLLATLELRGMVEQVAEHAGTPWALASSSSRRRPRDGTTCR